MFEKEAEEYAEGMAKYYESAHGSIPSQFEKYLRKAVEYGYNKANEWHYVSKKGFPKDEKAYFVIINYGALGNECGVMENLNKDKPKNVIAWKEIVLPKESK
jgi:hypothetical protein